MNSRKTKTANTDAPVATQVLATRLASALRAMAAGLVNLHSESTSTERTFSRFVLPLAPSIAITPESLAVALKIGPRYHIDLISAAGQLDASEWDADQQVGYRLLTQMMSAKLGDLFIAFVRGDAVIRVRTYIFGRLDDRFLVGLRAITIET